MKKKGGGWKHNSFHSRVPVLTSLAIADSALGQEYDPQM